LTVGRAAFADVDHHIKQRPPAAPDQLVLGMGRGLKVQSTNGVDLTRKRMVILHKLNIYPMFLKGAVAIAFGKKAAVIPKAAWGDQFDRSNQSILDVQSSPQNTERI
jgi:hypothetical protein